VEIALARYFPVPPTAGDEQPAERAAETSRPTRREERHHTHGEGGDATDRMASGSAASAIAASSWSASSSSSSSSHGVCPPLKPELIAGEHEVAQLTDVIHLNTIETVTGVGAAYVAAAYAAAAGAYDGTLTSPSSAHVTASAATSSSFWKGNLVLSNFALSFMVTDGAATGHHSVGAHAGVTPAVHPNQDPSNASLLLIPVASVWKMEYGQYKGPNKSKEEREQEKAQRAAEKATDALGDYSGYGSSNVANPLSTDAELREIAFQLTLHCRDARVLSFGILRKASANALGGSAAATAGMTTAQAIEDRQTGAAEFCRLLKKYCFPKDTKKLFAYTYTGSQAARSDHKHGDGWTLYDIRREFLRMGVGSHPADPTIGLSLIYPRRKCRWRLDETNAKFEFSPTYPAAFWVPSELTDKELGKVKSFRSKGRLPALVYNYSDLLDYAGLGMWSAAPSFA
jgi:hypothetical protein